MGPTKRKSVATLGKPSANGTSSVKASKAKSTELHNEFGGLALRMQVSPSVQSTGVQWRSFTDTVKLVSCAEGFILSSESRTDTSWHLRPGKHAVKAVQQQEVVTMSICYLNRADVLMEGADVVVGLAIKFATSRDAENGLDLIMSSHARISTEVNYIPSFCVGTCPEPNLEWLLMDPTMAPEVDQAMADIIGNKLDPKTTSYLESDEFRNLLEKVETIMHRVRNFWV